MMLSSHSRSITRIGLLGLGTIGKRLADAVLRVPEFELTGVAVRRPSPALAPMMAKSVPVYASHGINPASFTTECAGGFEELLSRCDIILDCTPRGTGADLEPFYDRADVRAIYQGGEASALAATSYCSGIGFAEAATAPSVRVVSCNTTGLTRLAKCLEQLGAISSIRAVLTRSAADPDKALKGQPNALVASPRESHHGKDIREFWPELNIRTLASAAPVNCGHLVNLFARMDQPHSPASLLTALDGTSRIRVVEGSNSLTDLRYHSNCRWRNDCPDILVWRDGIDVQDDEILLSAGIHMESIVIPETLDVLFAMTGLEQEVAMRRSDHIVSCQN